VRIVAVDLGRSKDPAALVAIEPEADGLWRICRLDLRRRRDKEAGWGAELARWIEPEAGNVLVLDGTGPHRDTALGVLPFAPRSVHVLILQIRREDASSSDARIVCVRKRDLVIALRGGVPSTVRCPRGLEHADELRIQLEHFVRLSPDEDPLERWGAEPGYHDDLVMALAMALWTRARMRRLGQEIPWASSPL